MRAGTIVFLVLIIGACNKKIVEPISPGQYDHGVFVLNEGLFEQNNASISFYDGAEDYQLIFKSENGRGLGDTANDFEAYTINGRDYIIVAVDVSSQVEIIDRSTMSSVAQIPMFNDGEPRSPRRILVEGIRAYVCNFDGTVSVIDLITNTVVATIEVGANPDTMVLIEEELFVANSGGLLFPIYDSTISVINTATYEVIETIETRINPTEMVGDDHGDIYMISRGNYDDIPSALLRIDVATRTVLETTEKAMSSLTKIDDWLYYYDQDNQGLYRYNMTTETFEESEILNLSDYETFLGFHYDPITNLFYVVDGNGYVNSSTIRVYDETGIAVDSFTGGLNSTDLIFQN